MRKFPVFSVLFFVLIFDGSGFSQDAPEGFAQYRIKVGDTLSKIAPQTQWEIIMRVNRIDERHLPLGDQYFSPRLFHPSTNFGRPAGFAWMRSASLRGRQKTFCLEQNRRCGYYRIESKIKSPDLSGLFLAEFFSAIFKTSSILDLNIAQAPFLQLYNNLYII